MTTFYNQYIAFCSFLIGENPDHTAHYQPASKRKISTYATVIFVPVIIWFVNGYFLVSDTLKGGTMAAFITGLFMAFIVFLLERAIISVSGSKILTGLRILLGFLMALLGSIAMDEVIFKDDIDQQMATYKQSAVDDASDGAQNRFQKQLDLQQAIVFAKAEEWKNALKDAKAEADGTGGSRQRLVGDIAKLKISIADEQALVYQAENRKLEKLKHELGTSQAEARSLAKNSFKETALLIRIKALFDLVCSNRYMLVVYCLITLVLFILEFLVVIIKITSKKTIDEELEEAREVIIRRKIRKNADRFELLYKPENQSLQVHEAYKLVNQNSSNFN